jgi:hypothetical protein
MKMETNQISLRCVLKSDSDQRQLVRCGCNPAAAAASTVFFSLWIAAAAVQTAATVSACSQPNTPRVIGVSCEIPWIRMGQVGRWPPVEATQ